MTDSTTDLTLAGDFAEPTLQEWHEAVAKVINRNRPEDKQLSPDDSVKKLVTSTVDGLTIDPLYIRPEQEPAIGAPGLPPFTRGTTVRHGEMDAWDVRGLYENPDVATTHSEILEDLQRGVTSLWLRVDHDAIPADALADTLADVLLDLAKIEVSSSYDPEAAAEALLGVFEKSDKPKDQLSLNLGLDPIGFAALHGKPADLSGLEGWVKRLDGYTKSRAIVVDGTRYHNAGAGDVHEVAWLIATATEYARHLIDAGLSPDAAFDAISFRVTASCDQFATIARLRALRTLWNKVGEVLGVSDEHRGARQHAVTSWREMTRDDAYVNILRGTICTFAASVGGAEAITVLPFDTVHGLPTPMSRRIARNTQVVLAEESNIGRVNDPAGGSWMVEALTEQIEQAAWKKFQEVEAAGGMVKALEAGMVKQTLAELNERRGTLLRTRKLPITGVSEFPKVEESKLDVPARPEAPAFEGLPGVRDAQIFEDLRDRAAKAVGASVFLADLGTRRDFGGREGFASNLFHIAGLQTPSVEGGTTEEIVEAWKKAGTPVVCLCSSAKVYAQQGLEVANALKAAGATMVVLAGNPKELGEGDASAIDRSIALGVDVVETLEAVMDTMGVEK